MLINQLIKQEPKSFQIRSQPKLIHSTTGTRDMQPVELSLRILYRPIENKLKEILDNQGENYDERVIPSIGNEVLKSVVAQYYADQMLTQREKIYQDIKEGMTQRAKEFNMEIDDVSITHLAFSRDYAQSIEKKQVAQQEAERAKYIVQIREQEKEASILRAEGDAEAARLVAEAMATYGQGLVAIRKIEAATEIMHTLKNSPNVSFLSNNTLNMVNLGHA